MLFGYSRFVINTADAAQRTRVLEELGCTRVFLGLGFGRTTELARTCASPEGIAPWRYCRSFKISNNSPCH